VGLVTDNRTTNIKLKLWLFFLLWFVAFRTLIRGTFSVAHGTCRRASHYSYPLLSLTKFNFYYIEQLGILRDIVSNPTVKISSAHTHIPQTSLKKSESFLLETINLLSWNDCKVQRGSLMTRLRAMARLQLSA